MPPFGFMSWSMNPLANCRKIKKDVQNFVGDSYTDDDFDLSSNTMAR